MAIIRGIAMSDKMTPREIIRRVVAHRDAPRIGWNFSSEHNDFIWVPGRAYLPPPPDPYARWGNHEELKKLTGFSGEVYRDRFGNIYGRYSACDKYVITGGASLFSALRDARLMANALADVLLEPEMVTAFLDCIVEHELKVLDYIAGTGVDAAMFGDDWGTQTSTFISPESFRELFFPQYKRIFEAYHERGIAIFLHSCGYIYNFIPMFIEAGVDVFQFDQPDAYPSERLSEEFGDKAVFHSPVDIQKVLPTGDLELIGRRAAEMCEIFDKNKAWIAKDYPTYHDIGVDPAWAKHAENVIVERTKLSPDGSI